LTWIKVTRRAVCDRALSCRTVPAMINSDNAQPIELNISPEKVCAIVSKARLFDVKVEPVDLEPESGSAETDNEDVLQEAPDDPATAELREVIDDLNDDEVIDLIALAWVGRGDFSREDWEEARALAEERHQEHSAEYLMGMPALGDYLEEGLAALGYSCDES
jgi:uncharacterized protein DUF3775